MQDFQKRIGYTFNNGKLLLQAFTHRSYLNEHKGHDVEHNERLEFLGDAVLELVVTDYLYHEYPKKPEGVLTSVRAALVNTVSISDAGEKLGMNDHLLLSKGESRDEGRARHYILANTFESVIGALYLDGGYEPAKKFIEENILVKTQEVVEKNLWRDPKSLFQEKAQDNNGITPTYKTLKEEGPDHQKTFTIGVYLKKDKVAEGEGGSKQDAEAAAARSALELRGW